jgi:hypothetical protein
MHMNRIPATLILIICCTISYAQQPKALGIRAGAAGTEISYQHSLSPEKFLSVDAGLDFGYSLSGKLGARVNGSYNFIWASPKWTKKGTWNIYAGPGVSTGWVEDRYVIKNGEERKNGYTHGFMLGITGLVGLEYNFTFPLQLSLEVKPCLGLHLADKSVSFYDNGLLGFTPSLGIRYAY